MGCQSHLSDDSPLSQWRLPLAAWIVLGLAMCFGTFVALMIWVAAVVMPPLIKPPAGKPGLPAATRVVPVKAAPAPAPAQPSR